MTRTPPASDALRPGLLDLLAYWFGDLRDAVAVAEGDVHLRRWWGKDAAIDAEITARFGALADATAALVAGGGLPDDPDLALAVVVALDQLPRNIHRDTPGMYTHDDLAVTASRHAAGLRDPIAGDLLRACFVFMPLMHSERLADQDEMLIHFEAMVAEAERRASPALDYLRNSLAFARRHRDIVARFGRFPHRNAILGRVSTLEEEAFLTEPNSGF